MWVFRGYHKVVTFSSFDQNFAQIYSDNILEVEEKKRISFTVLYLLAERDWQIELFANMENFRMIGHSICILKFCIKYKAKFYLDSLLKF